MSNEKQQLKKAEKRLYEFQFPANGASWYCMKTGRVEASTPGEARRELVKRGVLEPFEARVAEIVLAKQ